MTAYHVLTLVAVIFANVMFRAVDVGDAIAICIGMLRFDEIVMLADALPASMAETISEPFVFVLLVSTLVAFFPNTQQLMGRHQPVLAWRRWRTIAQAPINWQWRLNWSWALFTGFVLFMGIVFIGRCQTEFIYFNF